MVILSIYKNIDLYKELVNVLVYAVCSIENIQIFKKLRDSLVDKINISTKSENNINIARKIIAKCLRQKFPT